ncbi:MAG TPA: hypothetical protein PKZ29_02410 [Candidatus Woesebacteria bacterium]|jgi:hypothetical protein|nr:hypothetical protein [Candidatus Woesebacteria bacterium]
MKPTASNRLSASQKALQSIRQRRLQPLPKWHLYLKKSLIWLVVIFFLLILSLGISLTLLGMIDNLFTPYFWFAAVAIFLFLSYFVLDQSRQAYRLETWQKVFLISLSTFIFGFILFRRGFARRFDNHLETTVPYYRHLTPLKINTWSQPQNGLISGQITQILSDTSFKLQDFTHQTWTIDYSTAVIRGRTQLVIGQEIKIIGRQTGSDSFVANEIRPWIGKKSN